MRKTWTTFKTKVRNRLDFIRYGQKIGYINIITITIDLTILTYSIIDYRTPDKHRQPVSFSVPDLYDPRMADHLFYQEFLCLYA